MTGLSPDTDYTYRVLVNGEEWAAGERRDWMDGPHGSWLYKSSRAYQNRFRTHPHLEQSAPLTFAVLGNFGIGVRQPSTPGRRQREVAAALDRAVDERGIGLILTTGDNIYTGKTLLSNSLGATGDEDDDWFFTFYQPYRYLINRVPVYPAVGNHDGAETEANDDRQQLLDNFFLTERFAGEETAGRSSIGPGLFYRLHYGADIEFICLDTSRRRLLLGRRFFEHPNHAAFLDAAFPNVTAAATQAPIWRLPFSHHPPYCTGPQYSNSRSMIAHLVPLFERARGRVVFSGHEHNFQCSRVGAVHYFITGSGGKLRLEPPSDFVAVQTLAWAAAGHFLLVDVQAQQMQVTLMGELSASGVLTDLVLLDPVGQLLRPPIVILP